MRHIAGHTAWHIPYSILRPLWLSLCRRTHYIPYTCRVSYNQSRLITYRTMHNASHLMPHIALHMTNHSPRQLLSLTETLCPLTAFLTALAVSPAHGHLRPHAAFLTALAVSTRLRTLTPAHHFPRGFGSFVLPRTLTLAHGTEPNGFSSGILTASPAHRNEPCKSHDSAIPQSRGAAALQSRSLTRSRKRTLRTAFFLFLWHYPVLGIFPFKQNPFLTKKARSLRPDPQ